MSEDVTLQAGWYPSPSNPNMLQWWDGNQWIGAPVPPPSQSTVGTSGSESRNSPTLGSPRRTKRRINQRHIFWAATCGLTLLATLAIFTVHNRQAAEIESLESATATRVSEAAAIQTELLTEQERLATFSVAAQTCKLEESQNFKILDRGAAAELQIGGKYSGYDFYENFAVDCFIDEVGLPSSTWSRIGTTRALDGRQEDSWPGFSASWTYHPDSGLRLLIEHAD